MNNNDNSQKTYTVGKYKVIIDRNVCIGAATCTAISPSVFALDDQNKAIVTEGASDTPENVLMAAQSCPVRAITIIDTETNKQIWPV